jgi:hypothetical protein
MNRKLVALFAALPILASCATRSAPQPAPAADTPAPPACDPRMTAQLKDEPPVRGSIVQPETSEERWLTGEFLTGEAEARDWGRQGWARAAIAKTWCETPR